MTNRNVLNFFVDCNVSSCSSQSRADLLTLGLAVTNILTGLIWLSIRPKSISMVRDLGRYSYLLYTRTDVHTLDMRSLSELFSKLTFFFLGYNFR